MLTQVLPFRGNILFPFFWQIKVDVNKVAKIKAGLVSLHTVIRKDHQGVTLGNGIGEGFLIGKEFGALHIAKQRAEQDIRRLWGVGRICRQSRRDK